MSKNATFAQRNCILLFYKKMNIAIFASGSGTNFQQISEYFASDEHHSVTLLLCNNKDAYVLERAKVLNIKSGIINNKDLKNPDGVLKMLKDEQIDFIVLAGFLLLVPEIIVDAYNNRIVNIHPALLPRFGGKGMYGEHVHRAVIASGEKESGITIHYVNNKYDSGQIICQAKCTIESDDTPETLAGKIHRLEKEYYPKVVKQLVDAI